MQDFILTHYLWFKSFHIIAFVAWMAGLLYLPRLFVYHVGAKKGSDLSETLKVMEHRLLRFIMNPAMIVTWVIGLTMLYGNSALMEQGWMHAKLTLVILLSVLHMMFAKWRKTFAADQNVRDAKFYKIWNEGPTVLMIIIVILAVAEPF